MRALDVTARLPGGTVHLATLTRCPEGNVLLQAILDRHGGRWNCGGVLLEDPAVYIGGDDLEEDEISLGAALVRAARMEA